MNIGKSLSLLLLVTLFFLGCTTKKNPIGTDWSHTRPAAITDSLITNQFSYFTAAKITGEEQRLIVGKNEQKEAKALIQFTSMPENIYQIIGTPSLKLVVNRSFTSLPLTLHFDKIVQNWSESQATWTNAYTDTTWQATYINTSGISDVHDIPDTTEARVDTLNIEIPTNSIQNWKIPTINGYSLQISTEDSKFLEIRSSETLYAPQLVFKYKATESDTVTYTYSRYASYDTFILQDHDTQVTSNDLILRSISPTRIFMKFDTPRTLFKYNETDTTSLSSIDFKHMTINKAELVLKVKDNPYFGTDATFMATLYRVRIPVTEETVLTDDDMEFIYYTPITTTSPGLGFVSMNFTPLFQAFTSAEKPNYGVIIRLLTESQDYAKVEFYGIADPDISKRPKINIIYTPPVF